MTMTHVLVVEDENEDFTMVRRGFEFVCHGRSLRLLVYEALPPTPPAADALAAARAPEFGFHLLPDSPSLGDGRSGVTLWRTTSLAQAQGQLQTLLKTVDQDANARLLLLFDIAMGGVGVDMDEMLHGALDSPIVTLRTSPIIVCTVWDRGDLQFRLPTESATFHFINKSRPRPDGRDALDLLREAIDQCLL